MATASQTTGGPHDCFPGWGSRLLPLLAVVLEEYMLQGGPDIFIAIYNFREAILVFVLIPKLVMQMF